ncbi:hypothetical protein [Alkalihalobacterium bogoriense]|uniref:hypothetical protein n=1 Tax=Alkalihalobacterium bogoriense TaxID=246272 RepID=UPI00047DEBED|nr:hypothetical protein [Alkalihalobacterium bogoriense]
METEAREKLEEILKQTEYTAYYDQTESFIESIWARVEAWIVEILIKLFPSLEPTGSIAQLAVIVIVIVFVVILCISLFFIGRNVQRRRKFRSAKPFQSANEFKWTYREHREAAKNYEKESNYNEATRHLFFALLLFYHETKRLHAKIWKTNWEYYDELQKGDSSDAVLFFNLALLFEKVTYGEGAVEKEEYDSYQYEVNQKIEMHNRNIAKEE